MTKKKGQAFTNPESLSGRVKDTVLSELSKNSLCIPFYQRQFRWTDEQVQALLDTVLKSTYTFQFIGSIITLKRKNQPYLYVIDGQQRITTIFLTLLVVYKMLLHIKSDKAKVLRESINKMIRHDNKFIMFREEDENYYETFYSMYIFGNPIPTQEFSSLFKVTNFIEDLILKLSIKDDESKEIQFNLLKKIFVRITSQTFFAELSCSEEDEAFEIFRLLNTSGEPLTAFEIMKPLMHTYTDTAKIISTNESKEIERFFNKNVRNAGGVTAGYFVNYSLLINGETLSKKLDVQKKYLIDNFSNYKFRTTFVGNFYSYFKFFTEFQKGKLSKLTESIEKDRLFIKQHIICFPLLYRVWKSLKESDFKSTVLFCSSFFASWQVLYNGTNGIDDAYRAIFEKYNLISMEKFTREDLAEIKRSLLKESKIKQMLKGKNWLKDRDFAHSKSLARYILLNYQMNIKENRDLKQYAHIEHIAPQSGEFWGDSDIYDDYLENIGNLVLIPMKENAILSNRSWKDKRLIYDAFTSKTSKIAKNKIKKLNLKNTETLLNLAEEGFALKSLKEICKNKYWRKKEVLERSSRISSKVGVIFSNHLNCK